MRACFQKKQSICTLMLVLYCGSCWCLSQKNGGSAVVWRTDLRCLRDHFSQLWNLPRENVCFKPSDVKYGEEKVEADAEITSSATLRTGEMNSSIVKGKLNANVDGRQLDEALQAEATELSTETNSLKETHIGNLIHNTNESTIIALEDSAEFQEHNKENLLSGSRDLLKKPRGQNETENATASILNDSILQDKEAMPSFDEWKKIRLEQEKQDPSQQSVKDPEHREGVMKVTERKRGRRNYASMECGAKLVSANPGAEGAPKVLLEAKDEYMLNPCSSLQSSGMWFIVELCETIHPTHIELANFELYSSTGKEFVVYMSDHYQSRDWTQIGRYEMAHLKTVQSFPLDAPGFGKVIKVEFLSIYENNRYYCPLSLVRVFGTSMVDDYEEKVSEDTLLSPDRPNGMEAIPATVAVGENQHALHKAEQAMLEIMDSESTAGVALLGRQRFDNCLELANLSSSGAHLWPSMKCRFAKVFNVQRSCGPLPNSTSALVEGVPPELLSILSSSVSTSVPLITVPSSTMTVGMISPTTVSEAEKSQQLKTLTSVTSKLMTETKNDAPPSQLSVSAENLSVDPKPVTTIGPNAKVTPLSHLNPSMLGQPTAIPSKATNQIANQATKENLFSRFENRIKKLELHMNLSGTYLEELSKRYRNQMEEMQAAFNKTVAALNTESKKGIERDQNQQQALAVLQEKLTSVTESLRRLKIECDSLWWRLLLVYLGLLVVSIAILIALFHLFLRRTITTYVWSEHLERRLTEVLERERQVRLEAGREHAHSNDALPLPQASQIIEKDPKLSLVKQENTKAEVATIKSEPSFVRKVKVLATIQGPRNEFEVKPHQNDQTKISQCFSHKRSRRRKKHLKEGFSGPNASVASRQHLVNTDANQPMLKVVRVFAFFF